MSSLSVIMRTKGRNHGFMNRMFSPGDLGQTLKPFVFLDFLCGDVSKDGMSFGFHPHSGIGTLTYSINAPVYYTDTEGVDGVLQPGGLEWMKAGGGAWHKASFKGSIDGMMAFQFWFALPASLEEGLSQSVYISPSDVPACESCKVLVGSYKGVSSPVPCPNDVTVLDVVLSKNDDKFTHVFPQKQLTKFVFVYKGSADVCGETCSGEVFVLSEDVCEIVIKATSLNTRIIIASGVPHPHSLALGRYSVHTNMDSLAKSEARIEALGDLLQAQGKI